MTSQTRATTMLRTTAQMVMTEKASMATNPPVVDKSRIQTVVGLSTKYVPSVPLQSESNVNDIVQSDSFAASFSRFVPARSMYGRLPRREQHVDCIFTFGASATDPRRSGIIPASLKWISGAIAQRDAQNVHQAVAHAERTVHELAERPPSTK